MVPLDRAIDRGDILECGVSVGFKGVLADTGIVRPENDVPYSMERSKLKSNISPQTRAGIDYEPISGELKSFPAIAVELVSSSDFESIWDHLVSNHHYLGYRNLLGHRLKYLAFMKDQPVAALSWSAPALKLAARDCFIGWSAEQRKLHLHQLASNSRFLVLPWVMIPNLASHVMALNIARLNIDWQKHFNHRLLLLETFIDSRYFKGTCYRASNWLHIGHTQGSSKQGKGYRYHGSKKEIYLYVLESEFRRIIGCREKPLPLADRPPQTKIRVEELTMILEHCRWHPQLRADLNLDQDDIKVFAKELVDFHQLFHDCFGRIEHQRLGLAYFSGLMSNSKDKSVEPIALEFLDKKAVRSLQMFMKNYRWDHLAMQRTHQSMLAPMIGSADGMISVDPSEIVKKGKESVGVDRQYCGSVGKVENCQSGVFVGYSSDKGYGLLNCRLYMPESWFSEEQQHRRDFNLVPDNLVFETKQQIALKLINEVVETGLFPAKWIGADAAFGSDIEFLNALPKTHYYFASIRSTTQVFTKKPKIGLPPYSGRGRRPSKIKILSGQPKAKAVSAIAKSNRVTWKPVIVAEGSKGPIVAKVARLRIYQSRDGLPVGEQQWLFLKKDTDGQIKYAISNAPKEISFQELTKASTMRWPIEQSFEEGKDQLGMDKYEHRSWPAWHRHMTYVFIALHFLLRIRLRFKKNAIVDLTVGPQTDVCNTSPEVAKLRRSNGDCSIPFTT